MNTRDFCFWLQGYLTADERPIALSPAQVEKVLAKMAEALKNTPSVPSYPWTYPGTWFATNGTKEYAAQEPSFPSYTSVSDQAILTGIGVKTVYSPRQSG